MTTDEYMMFERLSNFVTWKSDNNLPYDLRRNEGIKMLKTHLAYFLNKYSKKDFSVPQDLALP
jgi:hypothetical protein